MRSNSKEQPSWLGRIGIALTILYFALLGFLLKDKINQFSALTLNTLGDFLAGVFGPIAIFWLILGFFQQGKELKNSVATLELQAKELASSVEQQRELVAVTREQLTHERELVAIQNHQRKARLQPKLIIDFGPSMTSGDMQVMYGLNITNIGNAAAKISIIVVDGGTVSLNAQVAYIERGWVSSFKAFGGNWQKKIDWDLLCCISYVDDDGDNWAINGKLVPSSLLDINSRFTFVETSNAVL